MSYGPFLMKTLQFPTVAAGLSFHWFEMKPLFGPKWGGSKNNNKKKVFLKATLHFLDLKSQSFCSSFFLHFCICPDYG